MSKQEAALENYIAGCSFGYGIAKNPAGTTVRKCQKTGKHQ